MLNGLHVVGKKITEVKLVCSGAGAAALACLDLLVDLGMPVGNIWVADLAGVVYQGRKELMDPDKERFAQDTSARTLAEIIDGADVFLGLSAGGVLKREMVAKMAARPIIFALANPNPEILPEDVKAVRDDAVISTGRTDYPNQVNNVLCFPFLFRGALDVRATTITREMEVAAVHAVAELARAENSDVVAAAYGGQALSFGPEYLIPRPFDPRLIVKIAPAVAKAAMECGVAQHPIADMEAYRRQLEQFVYHSGNFMKPIFAAAREAPLKRVVYAEGEDERVLRATQVVVDENIARPILIGRPAVIEKRIEMFGLRLRPGVDFEVTNIASDPRYRDYWQDYHQRTERRGVTEEYAKVEMRRRHTLIGAMMVSRDDADAMICGTFGPFSAHIKAIDEVIGMRPGVSTYGAMNTLMMDGRQVTIVDTHVNNDPSAEQLADLTVLAAEELRRFGVIPKIALLSHSNFGTSNHPSAVKMREVLKLVRARAPHLEIDGEMHGDSALDPAIRALIMPRSALHGPANLLVMPTLDAANIAYNLLKTAASHNVAVGPVLLGAARAVHVLTPSATVRRIVNMSAWAVLDANAER
jgi:malate dehydrogenase (oxaloacetate-decarboxylating)(NADP+)